LIRKVVQYDVDVIDAEAGHRATDILVIEDNNAISLPLPS